MCMPEDIYKRVPRNGVFLIDPRTNEEAVEGAYAVVRNYFGNDLGSAIKSWGLLNDHKVAIAEVEEIVKRILDKLQTEIFEVFHLDSKQYISIHPECLRGISLIKINFGFVDHHVKIDGSYIVEGVGWVGDNNEWISSSTFRSDLSTGNRTKTSRNKVEAIPYKLCPNCFVRVPITGECGCGWRPADDYSQDIDE